MSDSAPSRPRLIPQEPQRRLVFVAVIVWLGVLLASIILTGCPQLTVL